jgi:hypothetical protein
VDKINLPIACKLTDVQFQERRAGILKKARDAVLEKKELADGFSYRFSLDRISITELAQLITVERECCPFLRFDLQLEPGEGPVWLKLTGPDSTKDFLNSIFS